MADLLDWVPSVQADVPNCPTPMMVDAIRQVVIDFCRRSRYWRHECSPLVTTVVDGAAIREYELDTPVQTRVVAIRSLRLEGKALAEMSMDALDNEEPGWRTATGTPSGYALTDTGTVLLDGDPVENSELAATVALMPSQDAQTCGDIIYADFRDAVTAGASARLKSMSDKPWTDPNLVMLRRSEYEAGVTAAMSRASDSYATRRVVRSRASFL